MLTYLYPSSPQKESRGGKKGLWIMLRCRVHMLVCLCHVDQMADLWLCLLLCLPQSVFVAKLSLKLSTGSESFKGKHNVVLLLISKKYWAITWLFDLSLSHCGVFLSVCFCRSQRFEVLSISCLHTIRLWLLPAPGFMHSDASFHKAASFA